MADEWNEDDPVRWEAIGRAIRVERTARGLERKDLAERSGLSYPYLSEIENGTKRAGSRALFAIAEALGLRPWELLELAETWGPGGEAGEVRAMASPVDRRRWRRLDREEIRPYARTDREHAQLLADLMHAARALTADDLRALTELAARLRDKG